jgi:transcription antitermination factor NusG
MKCTSEVKSISKAAIDPFSGFLLDKNSRPITIGCVRMGETSGDNWYAIYTKARHERKVTTILTFESYNTFYPTRRVLSSRKDRRKIIQRPLLPNYLFVNTRPCCLSKVANTPGVAYVLGYNGRPTPVSEEEIDSLRIVVRSGMDVAPHPYLREGDRVFIKDGPFKGIVGILLKTDLHLCKLVVSIHLMNRSVAVTVPMTYVEKSL